MKNEQLLKELCKDWSSGKLSDLSAMIIVSMICNPVKITPKLMAWAKKVVADHPEWQKAKLFKSADDARKRVSDAEGQIGSKSPQSSRQGA